jgi:hypothetical protein
LSGVLRLKRAEARLASTATAEANNATMAMIHRMLILFPFERVYRCADRCEFGLLDGVTARLLSTGRYLVARR